MSDNNGAAEMTNETNTTSIAPLPCPFCGSTSVSVKEGSTFRWRIAYCNECDAQAGEVRAQTSGDGRPNEWEAAAIDRAIAEWNKRDYADEIDRLREDRDAFRASSEIRGAEIARLRGLIAAHVHASNNDDSAGDTFGALAEAVQDAP